jgi:hypothetical protein
MELPPCGVYRTLEPIGSIEAGRLVYFHNHGSPGPGLYLPKSWKHNRVEWHARGETLHDPSLVRSLEPLPLEGFYRVEDPFFCCEQECRRFERDALLQLGYNANAEPILFVPEMVDAMLAIPAQGWKTSLETARKLRPLHVPVSKRDASPTQ